MSKVPWSASKDYWGARTTDFIIQNGSCMKGMCDKCRLPCQYKNDPYFYYSYICGADCAIKQRYYNGKTENAIALLRCMPSKLLEDYLPKERRTPTELKAIILDELECRGEYEKPQEVMRL